MRKLTWSHLGWFVLALINALSYLFLLAPFIVVLIYSFYSDANIAFPPVGWSLKWYARLPSEVYLIECAGTGLKLSGLAVLLGGILGTIAGLGLRHVRIGRIGLSLLFLVPLVIPPIVLGFGLALVYRSGGIEGTYPGIVIAHSVLVFPFVVRGVLASYSGIDIEIEEAAVTLGSPPIRTLWTIVLPQIWPGLTAGLIFGFLISFDEVILTLLLAPPDLTPLAVYLYSYVEQRLDPLVAAVSSLLVLLCVFAVWVMERLQPIERVGI
jgi:putative spermidine/putrescine transport system permease protein